MKNMLNNLDKINQLIQQDAAKVIDESEKSYFKSLSRVADAVSDPDKRAILALAGPSGSGKTTSAAMICKILHSIGIKSESVSLDDFYLGSKRTPVDENGKRDYESISALDLDRIHYCLGQLERVGECELPIFDFNIGEPSEKTRRISLGKGGVAVVEGLHAINPLLTDNLNSDEIIRIFINVDSRVVDNCGNVVFTRRDLRLMRRASRDMIYRNSPLSNTLRMWTDVVIGEKKNLFPYKENADFILNTFHPFEPALFKERMLKAISELDTNDPGFHYVEEIKAGLEKTVGIASDMVPETSLMREFI